MAKKRGTPAAIVAAADAAAKVADRLGEAFARELRRVLRETERAIAPAVQDALEGETAAQRAARLTAARQQFRAALREAGYDALATGAFGDVLDPMVRRVLALRRAAGLDGALTPAMRLQLEALGAVYRLDLLGEGDVAARALWRAATRGVFGGSPLRRILADLADVVERTTPQIRTLYDTSVSILGRQVEALQAGDDPDTLFAFFGPVDDLTRPWCLRHVGRVYSRREIDALDNGQIGPVFLVGGGYNCRHVWQEISQVSELRALHGTRGRIPEVQDQLDAIDEAA
jgi:hypothetical protein